jgi:hypothetical protein
MAFDSEGGLLVVNTIPDASNRDIIRYAPDKSYKIVTSFVQGFNTPGRPLHLLKNGDGWLLSTTNGVYRFDGEWVAERLLYEPVAQIRQASDGSLVAAWFNSQGFKKIVPYASEIATSLMNYESAIDKAANYLHGQTIAVNDTMHLAHQLIGLGEAYRHYRVDNPAKASTYHSKMLAIATSLRANQNTDGGWGRNQGNPSDPLVTAQVGYALDYTDPSPNDTSLRRAISWLLAKQSADGSWTTGLASTRLASTTWVAIWLPVILDRLGGIDTDLTVTFPANVAMSNPDPAPVSTQSDAEGRLTARWKMTGVTSQGRDIAFDLTLNDMGVDEERAVATDAHLTFNNTFTGLPIDAPIAVPTVKSSAYLGLDVATDQPAYAADSPVLVSAAIANTGQAVNSGRVHLEIRSPDGARVADLGTTAVSDLAAGATAKVNAVWNTANWLAGPGYSARAELFDGLGRPAGQAEARFDITAAGGGVAAGTQLVVDKLAYPPTDVVKMTSRARNLGSNVLLDNLTLALSVTDPAGNTVYAKEHAILQIGPGGQFEASDQLRLVAAPAGSYRVTLVLRDASGQVLDTRTTPFEVASTAMTGFGLTGTLEATPESVEVGDPVSIGFTAGNLGNAGLAGLPLTVSIVDPAAQRVLAEYPILTDLAVNGSHAGSVTWTAAGEEDVTLVAVLTASVGVTTLTLAQDAFTVVRPPIELEITQTVAGHPRILALASCADDDRDHDDHGGRERDRHREDDGEHGYRIQRADARPGDRDARHDDPRQPPAYGAHAYSGDGGDDDRRGDDDQDDGRHAEEEDHDDPPRPDPRRTCDCERADALAGLLNGLGVSYHIVTHPRDFARAFRSGAYNTYWLSGKQWKLDHDLAAELREAVYRGDSLLVDGAHDERNRLLDEAAGVGYQGKQGEQDLMATLIGPWFPPATLATAGRAATLKLTGGTLQASLAAKKTTVPALVSHRYGHGQSLGFAIDLVQSAATDPRWSEVLATGLAQVTPAAPERLSGGGYLPVLTRVRNLGIATEVRVTARLPAGADTLDSRPAASVDDTAPAGRTATWDFPLAEDGVQELLLGMAAPAGSGDYRLATDVATLDDGAVRPYGSTLELGYTVRAWAEVLPEPLARLQALALPAKADRQRRDKAVEAVREAQAEFARGEADEAIEALLEAVEHLREIRDAGLADELGAIRRDLGRLLQEAAREWSLRHPGG